MSKSKDDGKVKMIFTGDTPDGDDDTEADHGSNGTNVVRLTEDGGS
jgi:hypothetical protein